MRKNDLWVGRVLLVLFGGLCLTLAFLFIWTCDWPWNWSWP